MKLTFDPVKHIYRLDRKRLTSVTTILGAGIPKPQLVPWAARVAAEFAVTNPGATLDQIKNAPNEQRDRAAVKGTAVHRLAEQLHNGEAVEVPEELVPYIDGYLETIDRLNLTVVLSEKTVLLKRFDAAGRFDLIATSPYLFGGDPFIADLKTSNGVYRETGAQLAAYALADGYTEDEDPLAFTELPFVEGSVVFHVQPDETTVYPFAADRVELRADLHYFEAAHHIYQRSLAKHKVKDPLDVAALTAPKETAA